MTTATSQDATPPLTVLRRAWAAVQAGDFNEADHRTADDPGRVDPTPVEGRLMPVIGCPGTVGATVFAVALASAAEDARVVECCSFTATGLSAAGTAELGNDRGWLRANRHGIVLERAADILRSPDDLPRPMPNKAGRLTIIDVSWDLGQVLSTRCWLRSAIRAAPDLVVVTAPTGPGVRYLDVVRALLPSAELVVAVIGPIRKRWPEQAQQALSPISRSLFDAGRIVTAPVDQRLNASGLTAELLPGSVLAAAGQLLTILNQRNNP